MSKSLADFKRELDRIVARDPQRTVLAALRKSTERFLRTIPVQPSKKRKRPRPY